jgi:predicted PurR-regulated permease PerM
VVVAALVVAGEAFARLHLVIVPIVAALFLSTILGPPAGWLRRHGWRPTLATCAVFLGAAAIVAAVVVGLVPTVQREFHTLGHEVSAGVTEAKHWLTTGPLHLSQRELDSYTTRAGQELSANRTRLLRGALSGVTLVLEVAGGLLLTLVLTFFFVKDSDRISRWFLDLFDDERAADIRVLGTTTWATLSGYVRGTAINGLVNAVLMAIGLTIIGVPLVLPIAVLTFVGGFLPLLGAIVSGVIAALVALVSRGVFAALVVVAITIVIHHVEGYLVGPLVLGRAVKLHPVAVLLALTAGGLLGGVIGAFMAVPVTAVALAANEYYRVKRRHAAAHAGEASPGPLLVPRGVIEAELGRDVAAVSRPDAADVGDASVAPTDGHGASRQPDTATQPNPASRRADAAG